MTQRLILPMNDAQVTASINTDAYYRRFGYHHYGTDMISFSKKPNIYASGNGEVLGVGYDNACGKVLVVIYKNAYNHSLKGGVDVVFRYMHLATTLVKKGDNISTGQLLGQYGDTGSYAGTGKHLHLEADLDSKNYLYTPTVKHSNYLKGTLQGAYDYGDKRNSLRNSMEFIHLGGSQSYITAKDSYVRVEDMSINPLPSSKVNYEKIFEENLILTQKLAKIKSILLS